MADVVKQFADSGNRMSRVFAGPADSISGVPYTSFGDQPAVVPLRFCPVAWDKLDWAELERFPDRTLFQSRAWVEFVARTQGAKQQVVALKRGGETEAFFTYLTVRRAGLRIAGSPFKGWTTGCMGFNARDEGVREEALRRIGHFIFRQMGCAHFEVMDQQVDPVRAGAMGLSFTPTRTYEIDLRAAEDEIMGGMHASVRRYVRRAENKHNVVVEECSDRSFADDYYSQLKEVFAKRNLTPTYGIDRVRALIDCLLPTGDLLLLRARDRKGRCVATGIFPARHGTMHFWGGASSQSSLSEHPNEPLQWYAMRFWKRRGMVRYDMGGGGEYKAKYGGVLKESAWIRKSRNRFISGMRGFAFLVFQQVQRYKGLKPLAV